MSEPTTTDNLADAVRANAARHGGLHSADEHLLRDLIVLAADARALWLQDPDHPELGHVDDSDLDQMLDGMRDNDGALRLHAEMIDHMQLEVSTADLRGLITQMARLLLVDEMLGQKDCDNCALFDALMRFVDGGAAADDL